ncbi:cytochrome B561 [Actibacterium atlanticum]|uniref:Cytochrome B561 n=1 Tax=Actibacterium atlanticum TaxID=1461693 RepID=A0A058ZHK9_9RHOB|nr:cytochrome b/b6 domain-containing protein [Actibacterium atlanticum]KCV81119.1 cytochrome B561 [Actibacterium atlanticum]
MSDIPTPFEGLVDDGHPVWDRFIRVFHWALVVSVVMALASGFLLDASWIRLHLVSGSLAVALVVARIVWGFTGPTYARFSQFIPTLRQISDHLKAGADHARHIGHNPLGALMVVALLALIIALGVTGIAALGSGLKTGPLAASLTASQGPLWTELHELAGFILLGLIVLHVGGVIVESRRSRECLACSMVTGRKEERNGDLVAPPRPTHLVLAILLISGLVIGAVVTINGLSQCPLTLPPVGPMAQVYGDVCAACHMAYHPSTRPAASWELMMGGLGEHFGEDASLPEETRIEVAAWLTEHAAATTDSKPALLWSDLRESTPVALPDTEAWKRLHTSVDEASFRQRNIYSRSNCIACHADAETGWFSPFQISIPKEPKQ